MIFNSQLIGNLRIIEGVRGLRNTWHMPKRLDEADAISIMRSADFEPLEPYKLIKAAWKCRCLRCGNITYPILNNVKSGHGRGCKTCGRAESGRLTSLRKRTKISDLNKLLSEKNLVLLDHYENQKTEYKFKCLDCKYEFKTKVVNLKATSVKACPSCRKKNPVARKAPKSPVQKPLLRIQTSVFELGFNTSTVEGYSTDTIGAKCISCHQFFSGTYRDFKSRKIKCDCAKQSRKLKRQKQILQEAEDYALSRGGRVLATTIETKSEYVTWECSNGHLWSQPTGAVVANNSWCPTCNGNSPRNLEDLRKVAEQRGGKLLSTIYKNVDSSYDFECSLGHKFTNTFKHVESGGQWCPRCNKGSKSEEICRSTFEQLFGFEFPKKRPKWLRNSRNRQMEIDGYCEELGIGFEYQGIQHFSKQFFSASLEQRILDDELKARLCSEHGICLFIIDYTMEYAQFPQEIERQAMTFKLNVSGIDFSKPIDISKAYIRDDRLPILRQKMKEKSITVLSTKWIGVKDKYSFRCEVCGHEWEAAGSDFFNSRRISGCQKCAIAKLAGSNRLTLEEIHEFANIHGGICLSTEYGDIKQKYKFKCDQGHEFEDIFNNMKYRNTFCPTCEKRSKKKILSNEEAIAILTKFNLQPMTSRPKLLSLSWPAICLVCGEEVSTSLQHLLDRGSPCKYCSGASISERKVRQVFAQAKLEPIEPFKTGTAPWKSKCLTCGSIVNGRYSNLIKGQSGCRTCYYKKKRK